MELYNGLYPEPTSDQNYISKDIYLEILKKEPKPLPLIMNNFARSRYCEDIIQYFDSKTSLDRSIQGVVNKMKRDCKYVLLPEKFFEPIKSFIENCMNSHFGYEIDSNFSAIPMIYKYEKGVGMEYHHDIVTQNEIERGKISGQPIVGGDFTIVLFLNSLSEEQGGRLQFIDFEDYTFIPKTGSIIAFRVDLIHGVSPIIYGNRYTVVSRVFIKKKENYANIL
jgi:PKHD-type hydroxylase